MTDPQTTVRSTYRPLTLQEQALCDRLKDDASSLFETLYALPRSRERSLAETKLEECVMWAVKAVTAPPPPIPG